MERKREKQATGEAIGAANGKTTPAPADKISKETTLLQLFEEAMKERPRDIEDALKKLPRSKQLGETNISINDTAQKGKEMGNSGLPKRMEQLRAKTQANLQVHNQVKRQQISKAVKGGSQRRIDDYYKPTFSQVLQRETPRSHKNQGTKQNQETITQSFTHQTQPKKNLESINGAKIEEEQGWTVVKRKHRPSIPKPQIHMSLEEHKQRLITEGRCFTCLSKGHNRRQCKNQIRCLLCNSIGHTTKTCALSIKRIQKLQPKPKTSINTTTKQHLKTHQLTIHNIKPIPKSSQKPPQKPPLKPFQKQPKKPTKKQPALMDQLQQLDNYTEWETMSMHDTSRYESKRPLHRRVYVAPSALNTQARVLLRAAIVRSGPNATLPGLANHLATNLARHFGISPSDFTVSQVPRAYGDHIVIFPSRRMRDQAVRVKIFTIQPDVHVQLVEWHPHMATRRDELSTIVRLELHGVPFQHWNIIDLNNILAEEGHVVRLAPVFDNGNFETVRLLLACHNPGNIAQQLTMSCLHRKARVHIDMDGWLDAVLLPSLPDLPRDEDDPLFPPPGDNQSNGLPIQQGDDTPHGPGPSNVASHVSHMGFYQQGPQRILTQDLVASPKQSIPIHAHTKKETTLRIQFQGRDCFPLGEVRVYGVDLTGAAMLFKSILNTPSRSVFSNHTSCQIELFGQLSSTMMSPKPTEKERVIDLTEAQSLVVLEENNFGPFKGPEAPMTGRILGKENFGLTENINLTEGPNSVEITELPNEIEEEGQSPPGFPGPPQYLPPVIRRSPRLSAKNIGKYQSAEDRARKINKPGTAGFKRNATKKKDKITPIKLDYLASFDPLTVSQADAVIMAAGINLEMQAVIPACKIISAE